MALNRQNFTVNFAQGMDTKTDDKQVIPGKLLSLENGILTKTGKIVKRNGYGVLGNKLDRGQAITTFQDELIAFDGSNAFSYSYNQNLYLDKGPLSAINIDSLPVIRNTFQQTNADSCIHPGGLQVFTWTDSRGECRYSCVDTVTGQIVVSDVAMPATAENAKPVALGNYVLIFYHDTVLNSNIRAIPIPVLTPSSPQATIDVAITVNTTTSNYDVAVVGDRAMVTFNSSFGGGSVGTNYINSTLGVSAVSYKIGESASGCITVFGDDIQNNVYVAYSNGTAVRYFVYDYSLLVNVLAPTLVETVSNVKNITGSASSNSGAVYYTIEAVQTYNNLVRTRGVSQSGAVGTASVLVRSLSIAGKAFYFNSERYFVSVFDTDLQPTYFVINQDGVAVAKLCFQLAGGTTVNNMVSNVTTIDNENFLFAYTKKDLLDSVAGNIYTQTGINSSFLKFTPDNSFYGVDLANNLHTTGGLVQMYDGITFVEHSFNYYPENITNSINTGAGSITAGTRQYAVTYEWQDNQGQIHRSTTSVPLSVTNVGATNTNTLTIPTLRVTQKKGPRNEVQIVVYRTVDAGSIFYQVSSITSPLYNDTSVDTLTYADTQADSAIIGNNLIYTTGGVSDNAQAEPTNIFTSFKGRIFYSPSESPYSYNYSKQTAPNSPIEFYDQQAFQMDQRGGVITALSPLDDKLVIFKERAIFYLAGEGPDATGAQNDFSVPQLITTDGGCIDASSVVAMPIGLMYKSAKGIYLLDRGLNVQYVGKDIEAYNGDTILSSTLVANKNQVRFALNSGILIVYDYYVQQWYVFTNHTLMVDTVAFNNGFVYLRSDGVTFIENESFTDNGNYIKMRAKTGWFSLAGLQGFQRVYKAIVIGNYVSKHKLKISLAYDFNDIAVEDTVIDAFDLLNNPAYGISTPYGIDSVYGGPFPLYQFRYLLPRQKCEAIQLVIEDIQTNEIGEGYQLSALSFEVGVKAGLNKMGQNRSFS